PPFNVRLRDDKSFPYIAVTVEDDFPRVMFTRERHRRGVVYFGPYASAKKVRETIDVLNRAYKCRPCEGPKPGRHSGIPCLDYHIDRCLAPCVGYVSEAEYGAVIDGVIGFLGGDRRTVGTVDVIGLAVAGDAAAVQVFPLRDGKLIDRYSFHLENVAGQETATRVETFCLEYYGSSPSVPPEILVPAAAGDTAALADFLSERRGARVVVRTPERGEKKRLLDLAEQNAGLALESAAAASEQKRLRRVAALEELREALNLESVPIRIECFDISTIQGSATVASMVVFEDAAPKKAHYRKFSVRGLNGAQDDFAAMAEVIARRFARAGGSP